MPDFMLMCECPAGGLFSTGKKAKLTGISSLEALYKAVEEALKLSVPIALEVSDEDFQEWAEPSDLEEVPVKGKVRVAATANVVDSASSVTERRCAPVLELAPELASEPVPEFEESALASLTSRFDLYGSWRRRAPNRPLSFGPGSRV